MSLSLLQGYSSAEEEEEGQEERDHHYDNFSDDFEDNNDSDKHGAVSRFPSSYNPVDAPKSFPGSALPSALDAFSEIAGPPEFLNNCVEDQSSAREGIAHHRGRRRSRDKKGLPAGAVVESKAQLVGIHERVRSDIEGTISKQPQKTPLGVTSTSDNDSQPRMCTRCGIPKTYSSACGMVCPVCSDNPSDDSKKKGSTVKDKEKVKRMRGQSSHATWKSETEMHLRQQFD